jgi:hypothetical protein
MRLSGIRIKAAASAMIDSGAPGDNAPPEVGTAPTTARG